ncbi:CAP domain-containing protein [Streptomyces arboris]|uniref:CAP domain-containing protein n=1 Tax=Streptomyces arboris TaxID=2600619 RepID=A0A5N5EEC3_9ACTN|nr:hypothetical protein [Streptomyces arboris]KAB2587961.1 CAP domain-containing protein [Streptomyces arboris]
MAAGVTSAVLPTAAQSAGLGTRTGAARLSEVVEGVLTPAGKLQLVNGINRVRQMVLQGTILPRGKDIKMVKWDNALAVEALKVVKTHEMKHQPASDSRWNRIGQTLYIA